MNLLHLRKNLLLIYTMSKKKRSLKFVQAEESETACYRDFLDKKISTKGSKLFLLVEYDAFIYTTVDFKRNGSREKQRS